MLLKLLKNCLLLAPLVCGACATHVNTVAGTKVIQNNIWMRFPGSVDTNYFYTPYETRVDKDGNISTLVYGTNKRSGTIAYPAMLKVNCSDKLWKSFKFDPNGNWTPVNEWKPSVSGQTDEQWVQALCPIYANDGTIRQFITQAEDPKVVGQYISFWWEPNVNFAPKGKPYKVFKVFHSVSTAGILYSQYSYVSCEKRTTATSIKADEASPKWEAQPPQSSVNGFLLAKTCGLQNPVSKPVQNQSGLTQSSDTSIDAAKSKCSELGYKKGTDQYGSCVLKLSK